MIINVTVQWRVRGLPTKSFSCTRSAFADFMKRKSAYVEWLIADVCLTRWYFDGVDWYTAPLVKYVPNRPDQWQTKPAERFAKMKLSPRGFTQF